MKNVLLTFVDYITPGKMARSNSFFFFLLARFTASLSANEARACVIHDSV